MSIPSSKEASSHGTNPTTAQPTRRYTGEQPYNDSHSSDSDSDRASEGGTPNSHHPSRVATPDTDYGRDDSAVQDGGDAVDADQALYNSVGGGHADPNVWSTVSGDDVLAMTGQRAVSSKPACLVNGVVKGW